tara:strand:+ start:215 stop:763 length:549 start_codon:yes stop_codon:yes gene_type:complete
LSNNAAKWATFIRSGISPRAKVVYLILCEYMAKYGRVYVRQNTLAKQLKWSRRTVIRSLDELERAKWIARKRLPSSCMYYVKEQLLTDVSPVADINRILNTNNTKNTTKNTKVRVPDMAYIGKRLSRGYKMKVQEPNTPLKTTKAEQDRKNKFLESMDKYDRAKWWAAYMDGKIKPPKGFKI